MTKKTISQDDRLRLIGLLKLAEDHNKMLRDIERSACGITGQKVGHHTSDAIWTGDRDADKLLWVLGIKVEQPSTTPEEVDEKMGKAMDIAERIKLRGYEG